MGHQSSPRQRGEGEEVTTILTVGGARRRGVEVKPARNMNGGGGFHSVQSDLEHGAVEVMTRKSCGVGGRGATPFYRAGEARRRPVAVENYSIGFQNEEGGNQRGVVMMRGTEAA
jgi:hypothetical protein